jgi:hypothetical protein
MNANKPRSLGLFDGGFFFVVCEVSMVSTNSTGVRVKRNALSTKKCKNTI